MKARAWWLIPFIGACYFGGSQDSCVGVCWSYTQAIVDGDMDGDFDLTCKNSLNQDISVQLPDPAEMTGRQCVDNASHLEMREVVESVNHNGNVTGVSTTTYVAKANLISADLQVACRDYLSLAGCAIGCSNPQECTQQQQDAWDAWSNICDTFLVEPSQTAMLDFTGCNGWDPPQQDSTDLIPMDDPDDCFSLDTGAGDDLGEPPGVCDGDGEAGDGADETGEESGFGDLENLISCSPSTTCAIAEELVSNVQANFQIFYDERVLLTMVELPGGTSGGTIVGAQLTGLDSGEDSYDLLWTEFSMRNDDVITHVKGIALDSPTNVLAVVDNLLATSWWTITVRRARSGGWDTLNYSIQVPPTAP